RATRLFRLHEAGKSRPAGADRLRRRAGGNHLSRRAVPDHAREHRTTAHGNGRYQPSRRAQSGEDHLRGAAGALGRGRRRAGSDPVPYPRRAPRLLRLVAPYGVWLWPAWRACRRAIKRDRPDAVLTSGPPHVVHLLGLALKRREGLPWVADFRDPWISGVVRG